MLHQIATFVIAVDEHEPSKTPFYIGGGILALWAVLLGFIGLRSETFPATKSAARGVMAISALLVAFAVATALITSQALDDGLAISYHALRRGTVVRSSDGVELGKVRRVEEETRSHIFDGIVLDTPDGRRFLDAPEVAHIAERAVTTTFPAAEAGQYLAELGSAFAKRAKNTTTARRARRFGRNLRSRWDRR